MASSAAVVPLPKSKHSQHAAVAALLVGTLFWGAGFTWAKRGGAAINDLAGVGSGAVLGPVVLLAWRFLAAGAIWMLLFPQARRGWNRRSLLNATLLGLLLGAGLIAQHLGLDRTTEAVSAFLTALTVLFVPLLMTFAIRSPPASRIWIAVSLATVGIWLMTGATPTGFGVGEALGLGCALLFSFYILAVNAILPRESSWRMTGGQFLVIGIICLVWALLSPGGDDLLLGRDLLGLLSRSGVWQDAVLLILFPTLIAFGLLVHFQPRVDPTHAAIIYLFEPVFAAAFAYATIGRTMGRIEFAGAVLILMANTVAELFQSRK